MDNLPQHTSGVFLLRPMVGFYSGVDSGMRLQQYLYYLVIEPELVAPKIDFSLVDDGEFIHFFITRQNFVKY